MHQYQQPPQQMPNQFQQPNYSQPQPFAYPFENSQQNSVQPQQQPLRRIQSQFEEFKSHNDNEEQNEPVIMEGTAPPEQESTDVYEYQDDNMGLYPSLDKGVVYNLPPIPISMYDSQARKLLEEERNQHQHQYHQQQQHQQFNPQYSQEYTNYQQ